MKLVLLAVVCLAVVCAVSGSKFTENEYQTAFTEWQRSHSKAFTSDEFLPRYGNFKAMFDFIQEHNSKNKSWTVGLNQYSHLTNAEFRRLFLADFSSLPRPNAAREYTGEDEHVSRGATVDWRSKQNAIRDQGQCGSCWTFAATASIEGAWAIRTGRLPQLSEQHLLDCTSANYGCNGGWPQDAMNYIKNAGGHSTRSSYPYKAAKGSCAFNIANSAATVSGYTMVQAGNEGALLSALAKQPVVVCFDAGQSSFQSYKSGVYNDAACTTTLNHAVLAVGYGNDGAGDYYLVRNSWGTWWGNQGYFQIARNVNRCGIANAASYPSTTGTGNRV